MKGESTATFYLGFHNIILSIASLGMGNGGFSEFGCH
jgi:hypothetical protein